MRLFARAVNHFLSPKTRLCSASNIRKNKGISTVSKKRLNAKTPREYSRGFSNAKSDKMASLQEETKSRRTNEGLENHHRRAFRLICRLSIGTSRRGCRSRRNLRIRRCRCGIGYRVSRGNFRFESVEISRSFTVKSQTWNELIKKSSSSLRAAQRRKTSLRFARRKRRKSASKRSSNAKRMLNFRKTKARSLSITCSWNI